MKTALIIAVTLFFSYASFASGLSPKAYRQLNDLQQAVLKADTDPQRQDAKQQLLSLKIDLAFNPTGLALTLQTLAQLEFLQNQQAQAIVYLNEALAIKNLEPAIYVQVASYLAQLLFNEGRYIETIELVNKIAALKPPQELAFDYALMAASHYALDQIPQGLPMIVKAINLKQNPKEAWLQMAFTGYVQLKNYERALIYINRLVYEYPNKKDYWLQKSSVHQLAGDYRLASNVKELTYIQGFIESDTDFINLAQLLASQGDPYKVAKLLQKEVSLGTLARTEKTQRLIYSAYLQAKEIEQAIAAMQLAFKSFTNVQDGLLLSQYLAEQENWQEANAILLQLLADGRVEQGQQGEILFLLGVCQFQLDDKKNALISLGKASAIPKTSSKAKSWMNYIKQFDR